MLVEHSSGPANRIVGQRQVSSGEAAARETTFWSAVVAYLIESFALYAASVHPAALYPDPVEPRPRERNIQPRQVSARERRGHLRLVSRTTSSAGPEPETTPRPPAGYATGLVGDSEREIERAVAALAKLDDRTLRELGIPHRSQIERAVRYCHDC
jgi:hypothetical protein